MSASTRQKAALRRPPAFQCYASDDLARATYYQLTLAERGLLDAMRRVYWVEDLVPTTAEGIALAVRRPVDEVRAALTDRVLAHFTPAPFNAEHLICRVLAGQMSDIIARREKQSAGGKKGAKSTNNPRTKPPSNASNPTSRS